MTDLPDGWTVRKVLAPNFDAAKWDELRHAPRRVASTSHGIGWTLDNDRYRQVWIVFLTDGQRDRVGWGRRYVTALRDAARQCPPVYVLEAAA